VAFYGDSDCHWERRWDIYGGYIGRVRICN
jgi:hypothetical protein